MNLKTFDIFFRHIRNGAKLSAGITKEYYSKEFFFINLYLTAFGALSLSSVSEKEREENRVLKSDFPAKDIHFCVFLNNICNTTLAAINLIQQGFDTQARVLVRTLDERIYQVAIIFASADDYIAWSKTEDQDEAKQSHYYLFSKKNRILKKVQELENKYLGRSEYADEIKSWRKERETYYSMAVHGSVAAITVGSSAFSLEDDTIAIPNLFGMPSSVSSGVLQHMLFQLHSLLLLLPAILKDVHDWSPNIKNEFEKVYIAAFGLALFYSEEWISESKEKEVNKSNQPTDNASAD